MRIEMNENDDDILGNVIITDDNGRELVHLPVTETGDYYWNNVPWEAFRNLPEMSHINLYIPRCINRIKGDLKLLIFGTAIKSFTVEKGNPVYASSNGLLLSADKQVLIRCPFYIDNGILNIPETVKTFDKSAFHTETLGKIEEIQVSKGSKYFSTKDGLLYDKSEEHLILVPKAKCGEVSIPETVTVLNMYDFEGCKNLETIHITGRNTVLDQPYTIVPVNKINVIEESSRYKSIDGVVYSKDCSRLIALPGKKTGTLMLPEGIAIEPDMSESTEIYAINIPSSLVRIDFRTYRHLREINISKDHCLYASKDGIVYSKDMSTLISCPSGKTGDVIIPEGVKRIASKSFENCCLKSLVIPTSVRTIDSGAFEHVDFPIHVHEENPVYESRGGKLFYKNGKEPL